MINLSFFGDKPFLFEAFFEIYVRKAFIQLDIPFDDFLPEKTNVTLDIHVVWPILNLKSFRMNINS